MGLASSAIEENDIRKSTTPTTRILPKIFDPRSPSEGITRTPIEVACTPKVTDVKILGSTSAFDTPKSSKSANNFYISESKKEEDIDVEGSVHNAEDKITSRCDSVKKSVELNEIKDNDSTSNNCKRDEFDTALTDTAFEKHNEDSMPKKKLAYLETDIDAIDDNFMNNFHIEHPRVKQLKIKKDVNKTAIGAAQNDKSVEPTTEFLHNDSLSTKIDSMSFSDMPSFDDLSLMVSDYDDASIAMGLNDVCKPTVHDWLITIEDNCDNLVPFDIPSAACSRKSEISNHKSIFNDAENNVGFTPDAKRNLSSNVERTPLSCLVQNKISEPIKDSSNSLKKKYWSGIQEERQRRGISLGEENTPPLPPPLDKVSSAPGKLMIRRRNIVEWDQDNGSVLI